MRTVAFVALLLLGPCDKSEATGDPASASASPSATAAAAGGGTAAGNAAGGGGGAAAGTGAAVTGGQPAGGAAGGAGVGTDKKGVMANTDGGIKIVNDDKKITFDGGSLDLKNGSNKGAITQTDAGTVLKGADGKTLTIPPMPGLK